MAISYGTQLEYYNGYLAKSPCRDCRLKNKLPACSGNCTTLNQVQSNLAGTISCSNNYSEFETYTISHY